MKKKVLICGSTGFIGRNCAEALAQDDRYEVYGTFFRSRPLSDPRIHMIPADLTEKQDVRRAVAGMDIVIQAAAVTSGAKDIVTRPYIHVADNAVMNALLFRQAFEVGVSHVVFFSCTTLYPSSDRPLRETDFDPNAQLHPKYFGSAWTKIYNEKMCLFYSGLDKGSWTVIRHSNVYGPYDKFDPDKSHVFAATLAKVEAARDGDTIVIWGPGTEGRDLLYVGDLVDLVELVLTRQSWSFEVFNAGSGQVVRVNDLVRRIIRLSGKNLGLVNDLARPSVQTSLCLDCSKAARILGWHARTALDDGILRTLDWYRQNRPQMPAEDAVKRSCCR